MTALRSPDCRDGKHTACTGDGWDDARERWAPCPCACHRVGELLEASSLGTPDAVALRASVPDDVARGVVERARALTDAADGARWQLVRRFREDGDLMAAVARRHWPANAAAAWEELDTAIRLVEVTAAGKYLRALADALEADGTVRP